MKKTDLSKVLAISGEHGLYEYVAQARNGVIAESLITKQRTIVTGTSKVTALADVSIYTDAEEMPLKAVFEAMAKTLSKGKALSSKSSQDQIKEFFATAVPNYDQDRFYVSHMKKVLDWYNCLQEFASLEFVEEEKEKKSEK